MDIFYELKEVAQQAKVKAKEQDHLATFSLCCANFRIYDNEPLQLLVTLAWHKYATIKIVERASGKFAVAVAPNHGDSIDFTKAKEFAMDEPLFNLIAAFPSNEYIEQLITCFDKYHNCAK